MYTFEHKYLIDQQALAQTVCLSSLGLGIKWIQFQDRSGKKRWISGRHTIWMHTHSKVKTTIIGNNTLPIPIGDIVFPLKVVPMRIQIDCKGQ